MNVRALSRPRSGFTLVELVMTIVLLGVLSVVALPRFFDLTGFDEATYRDSAVSILSLARQRAIASRRYVCVTITPGTGKTAGIALSLDPAAPESIATLNCSVPLSLTGYPQCDANIACPKSATIESVTVGSTTTTSSSASATFAFAPQGRPIASNLAVLSTTPAVSISISNQAKVKVQSRSGHAS